MRFPDWVAFADLVSGGDESERLGSVYRDYGGPASFARSEAEWRVTEFGPPNRMVKEGHGTLRTAGRVAKRPGSSQEEYG